MPSIPHRQNLGRVALLPSDLAIISAVESPDARGMIFVTHPDFTARAERNMRDDEEDTAWNDNRTLAEDSE